LPLLSPPLLLHTSSSLALFPLVTPPHLRPDFFFPPQTLDSRSFLDCFLKVSDFFLLFYHPVEVLPPPFPFLQVLRSLPSFTILFNCARFLETFSQKIFFFYPPPPSPFFPILILAPYTLLQETSPQVDSLVGPPAFFKTSFFFSD